MIKATILTFCFCIVTAIGIAQEKETPAEQPNTIDQQFTDMVESSNSFQDYKVVKKLQLSKLQQNTKDSIADLKTQIASIKEQIGVQESKINELNTSLGETQNTLDTTREEIDSINFLGIPMSKSGYKSLMWGVIGVLTLALLFFVYKYKGSNAHTQEANKKLSEVENEYEDYRKKALEKEQKLGRQLQDERNKLVKNTKG